MAVKKINIKIGTLEDFFKEGKKFASDLDKGIIKEHTPGITFNSFDIYKKIITEKRLELLRVISEKKPKSIKELALFTKRDFKNVYEDLKILKNLDLIKLKKSKLGLAPVLIYDEIDINIKIPLEPLSST